MHKLIASLLFALSSIFCFSQDFLHNSDYVYGVGRGNSVFSADSSAMLSLSMSLRTKVVNTSSYSIRESNNVVERVFDKKIRIDSSFDLPETRNYVVKEGTEYVVYRYFNKQEYIDSHILKYLFFIAEANKIKGSNIKHEKNVLLGYYYLAYSAINTPIMDVFCDLEDNKADIVRMTKDVYYSGDYGYLMFISKEWNGYKVAMGGQIDRCGDTEPIELIGFEYFDGYEWKFPKRLSTKSNIDANISDEPNTVDKYRRCFLAVQKPQILYRILYEKYENGHYVKIQVPDEWYFSLLEIRNPLFLS